MAKPKVAHRAKPKPKAKASKATHTKPKAKAVVAAAPKPKTHTLLPVGAFVTFQGYASDSMTASEKVFKPDTLLYIVEVDESDGGVLYDVINANDIAEYNESGFDNIVGGQVAPREIAPLRGGGLTKAVEKYTPVVEVGKLSDYLSASDGNVLEAATSLSQQINENYFYLGGMIAKILQDELYLQDFEGEEAFNDFCQATFSFKGQKGRALSRLYLTFSTIEGFDPAMLESVGWTKAAIAERYVTPDNIEDVLATAATASQRELAVQLKDKYESESNTTPSGRQSSRGAKLVTRTLTFKLEEDSAESVTLAIKAAMRQTGIEHEGLALERICVEWAQDHVDAKKAKASIRAKANKGQKARELREKETT